MVLVTTINVIMFESQLTQEEGEASAFIWVGCIILLVQRNTATASSFV